MRAPLRAGVAIYNAGEFHAAHDAWEDHWIDLDPGTDDERFLHGLIQFTAAVHHARHANWTGLTGLVESAREYLDGLPDDYRGLDLVTVRAYLDAVHEDPEHVERARPPVLTQEGERVTLDDLGFEAASIAAEVFAEEWDRFDDDPVERAVELAREDLADGDETSPLVTLVFDFARDEEHRDLVYQRLRDHVARREHERSDVEGLFEERK